MKWIIALMALMLMVSPAFAGIVNYAPNPSFEVARLDNASLPLLWYKCDSSSNLCSTDGEAWGNTSLSTDFAAEGTHSFKLASDFDTGGGSGAVTVSTASNVTTLSGTYNFSFNWKVVSSTFSHLTVNLVNSSYDSFRWFIDMASNSGVYSAGGSSCFLISGGVTGITCDVTSLGDGWYRTNITVNTPSTLYPQYSMHVADDTLTTLTYVDNVSLSNFVTEPPAPPPKPITGATAGIIGFLPLLIGVGVIVMVARRLEDMNGTEDFVVVIVGTGLAIVFLGVFAAIISGLI